MTIDWFVWLSPLILLPVVALFVFVGCEYLLPFNSAQLPIVTGRVVSKAGAPIDKASVSAGTNSVMSDPNGTYTLPLGSTGTQDVTASATGFKSATASVTLDYDQQTTVDFTLEPEQSPQPSPTPVPVPPVPTPPGKIPNLQVHTTKVFWTQSITAAWTIHRPDGYTRSFTSVANLYADYSQDAYQKDVILEISCYDPALVGVGGPPGSQVSCECTVTTKNGKTIVVSPKQGPNPMPYPPIDVITMDWVLTRTDTWLASKDAYSLEPDTW